MRTRYVILLCLATVVVGALIGHALMDRDLAPLRQPAPSAVSR
jgi:hypothetical protein